MVEPLDDGKPVAVHKGVPYSAQALQLVFEVVANTGDWRAPISALIPNSPELRNAIEAAVEFYTATRPTFSPSGTHGFVRVTAIGYRNGPAGP